MANIVLGVGTSHSPQLSTPPDQWSEDGSRYTKYGLTLRTVPEGDLTTFPELMSHPRHELANHLTNEALASQVDKLKEGIRFVEQSLIESDPDILVIFGEDHKELFDDTQISPLGVFCGDKYPITRVPGLNLSALPSYSWEEKREFAAHPALATHIVRSLCADHFDVMQCASVPDGRTMGHSFGFVHKTILNGRKIPTVPIWINTYYEPNRTTPERCVAFGRAVRRAIESWPSNARVGIVASGGLSHFTVDEELDLRIISSLKAKTYEDLYSIPMARLQEGTSEWMLWLAAAGAVEHLTMTDMRYVAGYRTIAGTGCAMGFARWA